MSTAMFRRSAWAAAAVLALGSLSACADNPNCQMPHGAKVCMTTRDVKDLEAVRAAGKALLEGPGVTSEVLITPPVDPSGSSTDQIAGTGRYRGDAADPKVGGSYEMAFTQDGHTDTARYAGGRTYVQYWKAADPSGKPYWVGLSEASLAKKGDELGAVAWRARASNPLMTARLLADFAPAGGDSFSRAGSDGRELQLRIDAMNMSSAGADMLTSAFPDHSPTAVKVDLRMDAEQRVTWFEVTMDLRYYGATDVRVRVMHTFKPAGGPVTLQAPNQVLNEQKS